MPSNRLVMRAYRLAEGKDSDKRRRSWSSVTASSFWLVLTYASESNSADFTSMSSRLNVSDLFVSANFRAAAIISMACVLTET